MDAGAQDLAADRLAHGETDARAETAADDQHEHRAERARAGVVDLQVVEHEPRRRCAEEDSDQQADVLSQGGPETALIAVHEPDEGGYEDGQVDQVDATKPTERLAA